MDRLYSLLIRPKLQKKDSARKEFLLNILLLGSMFLSFSGFVLNCITYCSRFSPHALVPPVTFSFFLFFVLLLFLSRKGYVLFASLIFIAFLYSSTMAIFIFWGVDVPQGMLMLALLIIISGILVGTKFAFFMTFIIACTQIGITFLQLHSFYTPYVSWKKNSVTLGDTIVATFTLSIIAIVSWLSNRETEKSLKRARASEAELKRERDLLEIKVEERTKELKQAQLEKVTQLYRFAEIGRLSSSLFHDLMTPLSLISLNLERLENKHETKSIKTMQSLLKRAIKGTKYLETSVGAFRKQLQNQELKKIFSLQKEIKQVIKMLLYKANGLGVKIILESSREIKMYGNQIKFSQLMTNLLLNAIDSYEEVAKNHVKREVKVSIHNSRDAVMITVRDNGIGIMAQHARKIFQPFFTTKASEKGTGIGLSISRDIVEKSFNGKITVLSSKKTGTIFTIILPFITKKEVTHDNIPLIISNK